MPAKSKPIDPENPPLTDEQLRRMRPAREVLPKRVLDRHRRDREAALASGDHPPIPPPNKGGRPKVDAPKKAISIRLDPDVIEGWRSTGSNWQTRMNQALRQALRREQINQAKQKKEPARTRE